MLVKIRTISSTLATCLLIALGIVSPSAVTAPVTAHDAPAPPAASDGHAA